MGFFRLLILSQKFPSWTPNQKLPHPKTRCIKGFHKPTNFGIVFGPGVFSLVCFNCDNSSHIHTLDEALAECWDDITEDLDLVQANYVGRCPDCQELDEEE